MEAKAAHVFPHQHLYDLVWYLVQRAKLRHVIVVGLANSEKLKSFSGVDVIVIDNGLSLATLQKDLPDVTPIEYNLEKGLPELSEDILSDAIVISLGVVEHLIEPHKYLKGLARLAKKTPFVLLSTPDRTRTRGAENIGPPKEYDTIREWSIDEFNALLLKYNIRHNIGFAVNNNDVRNKAAILVIGGTHAVPAEIERVPPKKTLAIVTAYNEEDIIENSIEHLRAQGVDVHVIDNWSTDRTFSRVKMLAKSDDHITYERYPTKKPSTHIYEWAALLQKVATVAANSKHEWIIHNDADELRSSPWQNISLAQAISFVDHAGYNAIDFTVIDFRPTRDGYDHKASPNTFFTGFEMKARAGYLEQVKCWKNVGAVDLAESAGHHVWFAGQKLFPLKFLSKHYPLRSSTQAKKKIFKDRKFLEAEKKKGWHVQYDGFRLDDSFLWDPHYLKEFSEGSFYNDYIIERFSGIGIEE